MVTPEEQRPKYYGRPVSFRPSKAYDFEICFGADELKQCLVKINCNGFELVAVTQTSDKYTVFFRRPAP